MGRTDRCRYVELRSSQSKRCVRVTMHICRELTEQRRKDKKMPQRETTISRRTLEIDSVLNKTTTGKDSVTAIYVHVK